MWTVDQPWLGLPQACAHQAAAMSKSLAWAGGLMGSLARSWLPQAMLWSSGSRGFPCGKDNDFEMQVEAFPSVAPQEPELTLSFLCFLPSSVYPGLRVSVCPFQLDLVDLQKELEKSRSVFPENPSVWVKDLAGYLNYKLQAPRSDPVLSQHPHGPCPAE